MLAKLQQRVGDLMEDNNDLRAQNFLLRQQLQEAQESLMISDSRRLQQIFDGVDSNAD